MCFKQNTANVLVPHTFTALGSAPFNSSAKQNKKRKKEKETDEIKLHDNFSLHKSDYIAKSSGNITKRVCEKLFDIKKLITILERMNYPVSQHIWKLNEHTQRVRGNEEESDRATARRARTNLMLNAA